MFINIYLELGDIVETKIIANVSLKNGNVFVNFYRQTD